MDISDMSDGPNSSSKSSKISPTEKKAPSPKWKKNHEQGGLEVMMK